MREAIVCWPRAEAVRRFFLKRLLWQMHGQSLESLIQEVSKTKVAGYIFILFKYMTAYVLVRCPAAILCGTKVT